MIRSLSAVIAGFMVWTVVFLGGNQLFFVLFRGRYREDMSTDDGLVLLATLLLSVLASVAAGWVAVAIAKTKPRQHAAVLGLVLLAVGIWVQLMSWDALPLWYNLCFLVLLLPATILGGRLRSAG